MLECAAEHKHRVEVLLAGLLGLLDDLDLGSNDAGDRHRPGDDLGDWFGGASPWLRRD